MAMDYTISARRVFGEQAEVFGTGPFAVCSTCFRNRRVFLFETREARDAKKYSLDALDCGAQHGVGYCFGAPAHRVVDGLKGIPEQESMADRVERPTRIRVI
jgi:hypothetical protein